MAIAQLSGERVRAYGSVSAVSGSRGHGRRAVAAAAVATLLLVGVVMLSGGNTGMANVLSMESEELGSADAMKKRMGILMGRFSILDGNGTAAANATAADDKAANNSAAPEEAVANAESTPVAAAPVQCSGNPLETYQSFSCWLAQYKDPEDVEVRGTQSKSISIPPHPSFLLCPPPPPPHFHRAPISSTHHVSCHPFEILTRGM